MHKTLCGHLLSFLWSKYVSMQSLGCAVGVSFTLEETAIEFSKVVVPFFFFFLVVVPFNLLMEKKNIDTSKTEFGLWGIRL